MPGDVTPCRNLLDELPLLARAGAVLPLLPADVDTLTDYPSDSTTSLGARAGRLSLLAFPRAKSSAQMLDGEQIKSRERAGRLGAEGQG